MARLSSVTPEFVEFVPSELVGGVLYVSKKYKTAVHLCACGCGNKVVTPLRPGQWELTVSPDGEVSLNHSIGNWSFPCQSHYWVKNNRIDWSYEFTKAQIEAVRASDRQALERRFNRVPLTLWQRILRWFLKWFGLR